MYTKVYGYYPLGYRRVLRPGEKKLDASPDDNVTLEYLKWQRDRAGFRSWDTHEPTIRLALLMFGDFKAWLREQQTNQNLSRSAWEFLLETIRFINTGHRHINVFTHMSLVLTDKTHFNTYPLNQRKEVLVDLLLPSAENVIAHWLRQPGGYSDLLCSLVTYFGDTQPTGALTWRS